MAALATIAAQDCRSAARAALELVGAAGEFLAVAGREQQGVVGGGADHEDGQDALDLPVDADDVVVGEGVHDGAGDAQGEHRAQDDHQWQEHTAVHEQQDDQDDGQRHGEEQSVDPGEGVGQVGLGGGRSGEPDGRAGDALGGGPYRVEGAGQAVTEVGAQGDHAFEGLSVLGGDRGGHLAGDSRHVSEGAEHPVGVRLAVGRRAAGPDDDHGERLVLPEPLLLGDDRGRLGAARQERRLVVGGDLAETAREGAEGASGDQPESQQDERDEHTGASGGDIGLQGSGTGNSMKNNLNDRVTSCR